MDDPGAVLSGRRGRWLRYGRGRFHRAVADRRLGRERARRSGPVMSAALVGLGIGALAAGPVADRIGRKTVLVLSVFFFGAWSLASAHARSIESLTALRFLTGLGLGAAMPNAVTLMSEYAPARIRAVVVNTMFCGFSVRPVDRRIVRGVADPAFRLAERAGRRRRRAARAQRCCCSCCCPSRRSSWS